MRIGDPAASVFEAYGDQIEERPNEYVPEGHYLFYVPEDQSDNTRVVFETDETGKVAFIRAGRLPEVEYIEGCA